MDIMGDRRRLLGLLLQLGDGKNGGLGSFTYPGNERARIVHEIQQDNASSVGNLAKDL